MTEPEPWGYPEQIRAHDKIVRSRGGIVWWKAGRGKTRVGIEIFESLRKEFKWEFPTVCLAIIKRSAFLDFRKELEKLNYDCVTLEDDLVIPAAVEFATLQKPTVLLVSGGSLTKSVAHVLVDRRVKFAIIDELYLYKNPKAERSKAVHKLSARIRTVGLSGSIMTAKNIEDIYGQLQAVGKHRLVAPNMTEFRTRFMNYTMMSRKDGKEYPFASAKPGAYRRIMELCSSVVDVHFPEKNDRKITRQIIEVPATPEQERAFFDLKKYMEVQLANGEILEFKNSLQVANKIQQIANGWLYDDDRVVQTIKSNKLKALCDKVFELNAANERVIIWCAFKQDVHEVMMALYAAKIATVQFTGGEPFDVKRWESGEARVCVATEAMGVSVNHFEQVAYAFYFSMNYRWMDMQQSMARTDRYASKHPEAFYYFLQVVGSLDVKIFSQVHSSRDWEQRLINIGSEVTEWLEEK